MTTKINHFRGDVSDVSYKNNNTGLQAVAEVQFAEMLEKQGVVIYGSYKYAYL